MQAIVNDYAAAKVKACQEDKYAFQRSDAHRDVGGKIEHVTNTFYICDTSEEVQECIAENLNIIHNPTI